MFYADGMTWKTTNKTAAIDNSRIRQGGHMATKKDYYEVLGVQKNAGSDDIKKAYRKLAFEHHPDRNKTPGAEAKFKEISEAYAVLSDDKKKAQYDQYGHAGFDQMYSQEDIFRNADFSSFQDMFEFGGDPFGGMFGSMFGGGNRRRGGGRRRQEFGANLETSVEITLEEAAKGVKKEINYSRSKACARCSGSGSEPGSSKKTCSSCQGSGQVQQTRRMGPMSFYTVTTCGKCRGEGSMVEKPCNGCGGSGKASSHEHISVNIPAGIHSGMSLRLDDLGEYGRDGPGELFVKVYVKDHDRFERKDDDLYIEVPISFSKAAIGGAIEVPTLFGKANLDVPPGTHSHTIFRLNGEGMQRIGRNGKGDELVRIIIDVPKKLTKKQKELLAQFDEENKKEKLFGVL